MDDQERLRQIAELGEQVAQLPKGYISKKTVNGKIYYYHQWSEQGIKKSKYLRDDELRPLAAQIEKRKELQGQIRELKAEHPQTNKRKTDTDSTWFILTHKRQQVVRIALDDTTGFIQRVGEVFAPEHLPIGVPIRGGIVDRAALNDWWTERSIPASRSGVRDALEALDLTSTRMLLVRCFGLSLSDQYWIAPEHNELFWEDVNFFCNDFSDDIGDVLFGANKKSNKLNFSSPDNTSDGNLKKRWKILDGKRCLIKGGSNPFRQQPFNEVIAAGIMERLGVSHVSYSLLWNQGFPYSLCEDFVDENTELVPAWRIVHSQKKRPNKSVYQQFVDCCGTLGIQGAVDYLDRMITVDYILANEDRHLNNFGALRDAETLEWLGMAPIYDSGSSLGYDKLPAQMRSEKDVLCKPFKNHHVEQLDLVSSFAWLDLRKLDDVRNFISSVFAEEETGDFIDANRIQAIADSVERRIQNLADYVKRHDPSGAADTRAYATKNSAERH